MKIYERPLLPTKTSEHKLPVMTASHISLFPALVTQAYFATVHMTLFYASEKHSTLLSYYPLPSKQTLSSLQSWVYITTISLINHLSKLPIIFRTILY